MALLAILAGCGGGGPQIASNTTTTRHEPGTTTTTVSPATTTTEATETVAAPTTTTSETTATPTTAPGSAPAEGDVSAPGAPGAPAATETTATPQRTLRAGLRGDDVKRLQERLIALGYSPGTVDGQYNSQTRHAVVAFQKVNGLARDGVAGPKTLAALENPKTLAPRYSGDHIEVSKAHQVLLVVKGGAVERIINASTGKKGYTTPSISSAVDWKPGKYWESRKYGGIMVWSSFFYGGVAVHGFGSVPSYPASHGCVRIPIPDSKYVYDNMPVKSMVHVY